MTGVVIRQLKGQSERDQMQQLLVDVFPSEDPAAIPPHPVDQEEDMLSDVRGATRTRMSISDVCIADVATDGLADVATDGLADVATDDH